MNRPLRPLSILVAVFVGALAVWTMATTNPSQSAAGAQGVADSHLVGHVGGPAVAVATVGNYGYLGLGLAINVLDITDPAQPHVVGQTEPLPCTITDVVAEGNRLYVVFGAGFNIYDLTNPATPALVGSWHPSDSCIPGRAQRITLDGDYAYTTGRAPAPGYDRIFDVRDPNAIAEVGMFDHGPKDDIALGDGHLYAAENVFVYNYRLDDPVHPAELGRLELGIDDGYALAVTYADKHVFVGTGGGLLIADQALRRLARLPVDYQQVLDVVVRDGIAYLAAGLGGGLWVVDVHDPTAPRKLGSVAVGDARQVTLVGHYAYVSSDADGLWVVDIADPAALDGKQVLTTWSGASDVEVSGTTAFIAASENGLVAVDLSDPTTPRTLDTAPVLGVASRLALDGQRAYVLGTRSGPPGTLNVFDISNPSDIQTTAVVTLYGAAEAVDAAGGLAYVSDSVGGLRVFDTRAVGDPPELGSLGAGVAIDLLVVGNYAYVVDSTSGLRVIDVSDPAHMRQVGVLPYETQDPGGMAYGEGRLYVPEQTLTGFHLGEVSEDLLVVDVTDPTRPTRVRTIPLLVGAEGAFPRDVVLGAQRAYVASGTHHGRFGEYGFGLFVAPMAEDQAVWRLPMPEQALGVDLTGDLVVVAANTGGLLIVRPDPAPIPTTTSESPTAPPGTASPTKTSGPSPAWPNPTLVPRGTSSPLYLPVARR
jgi:hypothetical protein